MKDVLSAEQFDASALLQIMADAGQMEEVLKQGKSNLAKGKILATLFYEPSTRTRLSFEAAMHRLGGSVISETDVQFSSITKGEVLADTARIISSYADIIAMRSKTKGDARILAQYSSVPVINAGDGTGEHPTQSLLDLYTIQKYHNLQDDFSVAFVGDLKYGRTVHSLSKMLRNFPNVQQIFVAPEVIQMPAEYIQDGDQILQDLNDEVLSQADVIYDTRIQKERFEDESAYEKVKDTFIFTSEKVHKMKPNATLMHPLPRVNEITQEVDELPQAKYFEQAKNGVPIRMALIARALNLL